MIISRFEDTITEKKEIHHINPCPTAAALNVSHHHACVADEVLNLDQDVHDIMSLKSIDDDYGRR